MPEAAEADLEALFVERWQAAAASTGMLSNLDERSLGILREVALGAWRDGFNVAASVLVDERAEALDLRDEMATALLELSTRYKAGLELLLTMPEHVATDVDVALGFAFAALEAFQTPAEPDPEVEPPHEPR